MNLNSAAGDDQLELISNYFKQGYTNLEILVVSKTQWNNCEKTTSNLRLVSQEDQPIYLAMR